MRLTVHIGDRARDVDTTVVDPTVTIGEVCRAITGRAAGPTILVDQWPYRSTDAIGSIPLHNGSVIRDSRVPDADADADAETAAPPVPVAELTMVAGPDVGFSLSLGPGSYDIGQVAGGGGTQPRFWVTVSGSRRPTVGSAGPGMVLIDGEPLPAGADHQAELVATPTAVFRLVAEDGRRMPVQALTDNGRLAFQRPPRSLGPQLPPRPEPPEVPAPPSPAPPFPWIMALAPVPIGLVAAYFFSRFFLIFLAMSPMLAVARWYDGRRRSAQARARHRQEIEAGADRYRAALTAWRWTEGHRRRAAAPDFHRLRGAATGRNGELWERRRDHDDFLHLTLGYGCQPGWTTSTTVARYDQVSAAHSEVETVPVGIDLRSEPGLGVVGPGEEARHLVCGLVTELCVSHGPSDVILCLLTTRDRLMAWDWLKWWPHVEDELGFRHVAVDQESAGLLLSALPRPRLGGGGVPPPTPVIVVDGDPYLEGTFTDLSVAVRTGAARAIVVSEDPMRLPALCSTVVTLHPQGTADVETMAVQRSQRSLIPVLVRPERAGPVARAVAAFHDPERLDAGGELAPEVDLRSLLGEPTVDTITARWTARPPGHPRALIGVARSGPLWLDLVADGPHALIAGTTGSGKSELLRTLVASLAMDQSPDQLNFVLIDFKGGGAFDACRDLPHTVGVVTDLDEHLAGRALRCLKAELRYREQRLREAGVSDLRDYRPQGGSPGDGQEPLPRLVVVVDEFAALAADLPEFMASLIDIAQRGRSLGLHMVLATQRPSGVVDNKIRANTNIRISLRVHDEADSQDVIGDRRAATLDRRTPGRGYLRLGASELLQFQTAICSRPARTEVDVPVRVVPFGLPNHRLGASAGAAGAAAPTDLELLATAATKAADGASIPPPRVPWPAPLPESLDAEALVVEGDAATGTPPLRAPLGLVDLPDQQRQEVHSWSRATGNMLVYGSDASDLSQVLATLAIGLGRRHSPADVHLYAIDFSPGGALAGLDRLPHTAAVVTPGDDERLTRLVARLDAELQRRRDPARRSSGADPAVVLLIANYGALATFIDEAPGSDLSAPIERLVRDGPTLDIFVVISANHDRAVPSRLAGQIESRLVMRMADATSYTALGLRPRELPDLKPGRAVEVLTGHEIQIASYRGGVDAALDGSGVGLGIERGAGPSPITTLGTDLGPEVVVGRSRVDRRGLQLAIGIAHHDLGPAMLELKPGGHIVVSGGSGSGRTNALRTLVMVVRDVDPETDVEVLTGSPGEWHGIECRHSLEVASGRRRLVVIDGLDGAPDDSTMEAVLREINGGPTWIIVADRPESLQYGPGWLRRVTAARTGLLLAPQPDDGDLVRVRLPFRTARSFPPGRGYLVNAGVVTLIQVARSRREPPPGSARRRPGPAATAGADRTPPPEIGTNP